MSEQIPLTPLVLEQARDSLALYQSIVHQTDAGRPAIPPSHLRDIVIPAIEDDSLGHTVIVAPPESAKTVTAIGAVGWWLGRDPTQHVAYISETRGQAVNRSLAIRDTIELSPAYQAIFPDVKPNPAKGWAEDQWFLQRPNVGDKDPTLKAAGVLGAILGNRFDRVFLDDIASRDNMNTPFLQEKIIDWLERTLMTRMTPNARAVLICTRWANNDPAQWAINQGWHYIHIPALDPETGASYWPERWPQQKLACLNDLHDSVEGKYCWEERLGNKVVRGWCKKKGVRSFAFTQQYLGQVYDESTSKIKRSYWQVFNLDPTEDIRDKWQIGGIFVDTAHTTKTSGDYSVILVMFTDGIKYYIVRVHRVRVEFPELQRLILSTRATYDLPVYIEDTPGAKPLIQSLQRQMDRVIPWSHRGRDKMARVEVALPYLEANNVYVPENASWVPDLVEECVVGDTKILTINGLKNADEIEVGDKVLTHKGRFRSVLAVSQREADDIIEIQGKTLSPISLTSNHPVLAMDVGKNIDQNLVPKNKSWIPAGKLKSRSKRLTSRGQMEPTTSPHHALTFPILDPDDLTVEIDLRSWYNKSLPVEDKNKRSWKVVENEKTISINNGRSVPLKYTQPLDYSFGRFCGLYLAEGSFTRGKAQFSFHREEVNYHKEIREFLENRFGISSSQRLISKNCMVVSASLPRLEEFFNTFGRGAHNKRIPWWAWDAPKEFIEGLIEGWLDGDGHKTENGWTGTTVSPNLAWGIRVLATRLGKWALIHENNVRGRSSINGRSISRKNSFSVRLNNTEKESHIFDGEHLGFWIKEKQKVSSKKVYNFTVDEDESYVTTGGTLHNCAAFPFAQHDDQVDALTMALDQLARGRIRMTAF